MKKILLVLLTAITFSACQSREDEKVVRIGAIFPMTGVASYAADFMKKGLDLAVQELNITSDYKYEVIYEDSRALAKDGLIAYNKLRAQKVNLIICAMSNIGMAVAPRTNNESAILFGTAIVPPNFVAVSNRVVRVGPNSEGMTSVIADYNHCYLKLKRPAVVYINNDMGFDCYKVYTNIAAKYACDVVYSEAYESNQKDFKDIINKIIQQNVDGVYLSGFGESFISFVRQFNNDPRTGNIVLTGDMTFGLPDTQAKMGELKSKIYYADGTITKDFADLYRCNYAEEVNSYAAYTYTIPYMIDAALKSGCSLNDIDGIYNYITSHTFNSSVGELYFTSNGESNIKFSIKVL